MLSETLEARACRGAWSVETRATGALDFKAGLLIAPGQPRRLTTCISQLLQSAARFERDHHPEYLPRGAIDLPSSQAEQQA
eukprot:scaffold66381_cov63-Phaeocystis_antarctica.AAC.5